jgi:hypothetical protein
LSSIPVYVVRIHRPDGAEILSAWPDVYGAKFEATRWEQDSKIKHDYVRGVLTVEEGADALVAHEEVAAHVTA